MVAFTLSCQRETRKTPPDDQQQQPGTILDDMKKRLIPAFDPKVKEWLGDDLLALIADPERIKSYRIVPKKEASQDSVVGYPIVQLGLDLTPKQRVQFQWLLLDQQSYRTESLKKCLFLPEYAFTFHKGDAASTVLLATSCAQIQFLAGGKTLLRDCDPALPKLQQLLESVFPETSAPQKELTAQAGRGQEISPAVKELLSDPVLDVVAEPETIAVYQIFPKQRDADATLHGYPILKQVSKMIPKHVAEFQAIILDDASYRFESMKKCLFLPGYAIVVTRGETEVTLLCDVNCGLVKFLREEQAVLTNWHDPGVANLHVLIENILATP
jgi:hypothetical protein